MPIIKDQDGINRGTFDGAPSAAAIADRSIGVTTTSQQVMAANPTRKGWKIKNDTDTDVWIAWDASAQAVAGGGRKKVAIGGYMASEPAPCVETGSMTIIHGGTGTKNVTILEFL